EAEHILRRDDRQCGTGCVRELDQPPVRLVRIEAGSSLRAWSKAREPARGGVGVVGAGVGNRVWQGVGGGGRGALATAEGPEEDDHPGQPELVSERVDRWCDVAEILRNERQVTELALDRAEELGAGASAPAPALCGRVSRRNRPVGDEATEVVDA